VVGAEEDVTEAHEQGSGEWGAEGRVVRRGERIGARQVTMGAAGTGRDAERDLRGNEGGGGVG